MCPRRTNPQVDWPETLCAELRDTNGRPIADLFHYYTLHQEGRRLIEGWLLRGWESRNCRGEHCFEAFIFTWIAFNSWGMCITDTDRDADWINGLLLSPQICASFDMLLHNSNSPFAEYVRQFHETWPIFKVQELRDAGLHYWRYPMDQRAELVERYLARNMRDFHPKCWKRHMEEGTGVPMDWPHTLRALYRVRNNLFHGEKAPYSEIDRTIVRAGLRVLVYFLHETPEFRLVRY